MGRLRGGLHLVFLDFGFGGRERRARSLLLGVVPHLLMMRRLHDTVHSGNQHQGDRDSNQMGRDETRRKLTGARKEEAMAGWKSPGREWCLRHGKEKGTVKEADLSVRGSGCGRAWEATAEVEGERTRRPRPAAAHHHRRIDQLSDSVFSVCVCLAGLGFLQVAMPCWSILSFGAHRTLSWAWFGLARLSHLCLEPPPPRFFSFFFKHRQRVGLCPNETWLGKKKNLSRRNRK